MLPFLSLNFLLCFYDRSKEKQQQAGGVLFFVKQITEFFIALSVKEKAYNYWATFFVITLVLVPTKSMIWVE